MSKIEYIEKDKIIALLKSMYDLIYEQPPTVSQHFITAINAVQLFPAAKNISSVPCDIGDTFYSPWIQAFHPENHEVRENRVSGLQKKADSTWKIRLSVKGAVYDITPDEIGKTVFYTKEEAEEKMVELLNNIKREKTCG